jgi:hypothetical protein
MKKMSDSYWRKLGQQFDRGLVAALRSQLKPTDSVSLSVERLGSYLPNTPEAIRALLDQLVADGYLSVSEHRPCPNCSKDLDDLDVERLRCDCGMVFEEDSVPESQRTYKREGPPSRDVGWVITVHGMNTPGGWQQDFSWRMAKLYGYAVPVAIYKYGNIKLSPLIPYRQERHRDRLLSRLHELRDEMVSEGYAERPDVITHSFGTWLFIHALLADKAKHPINVGRVILTGSIVRPDFAWQELIDNQRIEAVMCHYGGKDVPVRLAQYFIPNSGPSGRYGFNDQARVIHKFESDFKHSDYFTDTSLRAVMEEKWEPFLTYPLEALSDWRDVPNALATQPWSASRWQPVTRTLKVVLLITLFAAAVFLAASAIVGVPDVAGWLSDFARDWVRPLFHRLFGGLRGL